MNLTTRQKEILQYIKKYIASNSYPPTVREIAKAIGVSSPATIQAHLTNLENKGVIKRKSTKNRALELLVENEFEAQDEFIIKVPLLGTVTAGSPIEAIENPNEFFSLPTELVPANKKIFTLLVSGDSMINVGIHDGDIVIVEQTNIAKNRDIVVAMTDDYEVTLKTFFKEKNHIRLQPENDLLKPLFFKNISILGKAIGLYRKI